MQEIYFSENKETTGMSPIKNRTCLQCRELKRCRSSRASWIFFIIGMIATIALRIVTILVHVDPLYGQIAWYIGVTGFFIFFIYKYKVDQERYRLIQENKLMDKIAQGVEISKEDRVMISSILCALSSNKDRINYFLIFFTSALALIIAVYFDFIK